MGVEEIIRLIFSFLGGGLMVAIFDWVRTNSAEKTARKVEDLNKQIKHLYGPLCFFASQNEQMFKLSNKFRDAYNVEYVNQQWSQDENTQPSLRQEATQTIDLANTYIGVVMENNDRVIEILTNNYAYIDEDDVEIFQQFVVDYTRLRKEMNEEVMLLTPFRIYHWVGPISFMSPKFIERVKYKFIRKKEALKQHRAA
ncbi:MAG: hypothetical protein JRI66_07000 [Deltaproteobacteria bacterium]|nr:hypothetical protein [Deltaproteobacteria bacterium]